jgi:uracil-DNA glycosylase
MIDARPRPTEFETTSPRTRVLLMALRQALIIALGALETYLDIPRSIVPKHERGG